MEKRSKKLIGFLRAIKEFTPVWVDPVLDGVQDYIRDFGQNMSGNPAAVFGTDNFTVEYDDREKRLAYVAITKVYLPMGTCSGKVNLAGYWCEYTYTQNGTNFDLTVEIPEYLLK